MKYFLASVSLILLLLVNLTGLGVVSAQTAAGTLVLNPANGNFSPGCTFNTSVLLNTAGANVDGSDAVLTFDSTKYTANSVTTGTLFSEYPVKTTDNQNGKITISGVSSISQPFSGSGIFATISFTVKTTATAGEALIKFDFDPADKTKTTDSNITERGGGGDILSTVTDGTYVIGTGTSCLTQAQGSSDDDLETPTPEVLPDSGDFNTTLTLIFISTVLIGAGLFGSWIYSKNK